MQLRYVADSTRYSRMNSNELRQEFLVDSLFAPDTIALLYCDIDRVIIGSAVPGNKPLDLATADELRAAYFTERRELGILNIGGPGSVLVDRKNYPLENLDGLYIGRGSRQISFSSTNPATPAEFYLLSYPAHATHPTTKAGKDQAAVVNLGTEAQANRRTLYKYIHPDGIKSCQLVMGFTQMMTGSVWNTMPPHTHARRSEVYLYFNLASEARVFHLMGPADETRHLVVANRQAVISPSWSLHSGVGTSAYSFCWGMGGENQAFDDMDPIRLADMR